MSECDPIGKVILAAQQRLQAAARSTWVITPHEHIAYVRGSRSYGKAPQVLVVGDDYVRPFNLLPEFTHHTRAREVAIAMEAAAAVLEHFGRIQ